MPFIKKSLMNKKKIIRVTTADISLNTLLKGQLKFLNEYFEVVGIATNTGVLKKMAEREGIRAIDVKMSREINLKQDWKSLWTLKKVIAAEKPDIVHVNTPKGSLLGMVAAWLCRVPIRIYTVTGLRFETTKGLFRFILKSMERITCFFATDVIPEGDGVAATLRRENITRKPLKKIHNGNVNGIDLEFFNPNKYTKAKNDIFTFIFIGRIVNDKGMHELAEAMRALAGMCKLIMVGPLENGDPISEEDLNFFKHSPDVVMTGFQSDIRPYLMKADAMVFPSYREGFPNVILQAGAMGVPVITSDVNGATEAIVNGENGTIIHKKNTKELIDAMNYYIKHSDKVVEMSGKSRNFVSSRFEQHSVWQATLNRYNELLHNVSKRN